MRTGRTRAIVSLEGCSSQARSIRCSEWILVESLLLLLLGRVRRWRTGVGPYSGTESQSELDTLGWLELRRSIVAAAVAVQLCELAVAVRLGELVAAKLGGHVAAQLGGHVAAQLGEHVAAQLGGHVAAQLGGHVAAQLGGHVAAQLGELGTVYLSELVAVQRVELG